MKLRSGLQRQAPLWQEPLLKQLLLAQKSQGWELQACSEAGLAPVAAHCSSAVASPVTGSTQATERDWMPPAGQQRGGVRDGVSLCTARWCMQRQALQGRTPTARRCRHNLCMHVTAQRSAVHAPPSLIHKMPAQPRFPRTSASGVAGAPLAGLPGRKLAGRGVALLLGGLQEVGVACVALCGLASGKAHRHATPAGCIAGAPSRVAPERAVAGRTAAGVEGQGERKQRPTNEMRRGQDDGLPTQACDTGGPQRLRRMATGQRLAHTTNPEPAKVCWHAPVRFCQDRVPSIMLQCHPPVRLPHLQAR